jgi:hypothetical protein
MASHRWPSDPAKVAGHVQELVAKAGFERTGGGGGTLLSERIVVFRGDHRENFELLGQDGAYIGSAIRVGELVPTWKFRGGGRTVVIVRRARRIWGTGWRYAICEPNGPEIATVRRKLALGDRGAVAAGNRTIGVLKLRIWRHAGAIIEDQKGRALVRLTPATGATSAVILVARMEDGAPEEMRRVMLATGLIYDWQCVTRNRGDWGGG